MPGKLLVPVTPKFSKQTGIPSSLLYSGSRFQGHQKSKGNKYDVEVVLQVKKFFILLGDNKLLNDTFFFVQGIILG